ncbi:MAG: hypothetical protein RLZZ127_1171, partial [Planctomycetota bacterium]
DPAEDESALLRAVIASAALRSATTGGIPVTIERNGRTIQRTIPWRQGLAMPRLERRNGERDRLREILLPRTRAAEAEAEAEPVAPPEATEPAPAP